MTELKPLIKKILKSSSLRQQPQIDDIYKLYSQAKTKGGVEKVKAYVNDQMPEVKEKDQYHELMSLLVDWELFETVQSRNP